MHLLSTSSTALDDLLEPIDLRQSPGDIAILSFADSDLAAIAAAWALERDALPSVRLAHLRDLRHPMSVDLWIDRVGSYAKVILVRLLGGLDWWRYGRAKIATMHGLSPPRRCRPPSLIFCLASSAKAAARICAGCCAVSPVTPAWRWSVRCRGPCRA